MKRSLLFVATTPFAVNAFLRTHLIALAKSYNVILCVNTKTYKLDDSLETAIQIQHIDIARKIAPLQDLRAFIQLLRCFIKIRPMTVHSITPKAGLLAMSASRLVGISLRFHTFTGQVWVNKIGVGRFLFKSVDRLIALLATQVLVDSGSQCRFLEGEGVVRRGSARMLGQGSIAGVDLERFRPNSAVRDAMRSKVGLSDEALVFLFVGRLVRDKGIFDLIEAFVELNLRYRHWELWVVGPDEEQVYAKVRAEREGLETHIRWFEATPRPELYMASADIFVLPSYREGFGSVIIEAAACGIPTIAYRVDGVVDAVVEDCTGLLVKKGDVLGFAQMMERLGTDPKMLRSLGQAARKRTVDSFSHLVFTKKWLEFYKSVIN